MENELEVLQTKEEAIVDLYTIRGGLSFISKKIVEMKNIENEISGLKNTVLKSSEEMEQETKKLEVKKAELEESRLIYNAALKRVDTSKCEAKKASKLSAQEKNILIGQRVAVAKMDAKIYHTYRDLIEKKYFFINLVIFSIVTVFILMASGLPDYMFADSKASAVAWSIFMSPIGGAILAGIFHVFTPLFYVFPIITMFKDRKAYVQNEYLRALQEIEEQERQSSPEYKNDKIVIAEQKLKKAEAEFKNAELEVQNFEKALKEKKEYLETVKIQAKKDREIKGEKFEIISETVRNLEKSLYDSYNHKINKSDWENIDLLLYYLQTNRADTLKEALQLMDKQRQTNEIVNAIGIASQSIKDTIHTAVQNMSVALVKSFSVVSSQLSEISQNQRASIVATEKLTGAIGTLSSKVSTGFSSQISAMELNNALLEKANKSSEQLLYDLRYNQRLWIK